VILKEQAGAFCGRYIRVAEGNSKIDKTRLLGERILALRSFGKQFLIVTPVVSVRIHLMMFGSYRINEGSDRQPRLRLTFSRGEINFYACSVRYIEEPVDDIYDWRSDVMSESWDPKLALRRLRAKPQTLICDALLDQEIFAGVGNIIKNEVLFRVRVHPLSSVGEIPAVKLREIVHEARQYSFDFLGWKKQFTLRKHWLAHNKSICPRDNIKFQRAYLGVRHRRSFFCERCQQRY
jgi:endonuclease-8